MTIREELIAEIEAETAATADFTGRKTLSPRVRAALEKVRREAFVPKEEQGLAYINAPLPIGHGQTISQPFIVAIMTELLDLAADQTVLEIGTGSGYQAAILAALVRRVYTIEVIAPLADSARAALEREGCGNVEVRCGDGAKGWPERAPFDAIIVTAAALEIPSALIAQLRPGGRMVIPLGPQYGLQHLVLVTKDAKGAIRTRNVLDVAFVPLTGSANQPPKRPAAGAAP